MHSHNLVNAKGGTGRQKIALVSLDDKFDPKLTADNARKLIEEQNVVALFLTRGTPQTEAIIPLLDKHGVPLIARRQGRWCCTSRSKSMFSMCGQPTSGKQKK